MKITYDPDPHIWHIARQRIFLLYLGELMPRELISHEGTVFLVDLNVAQPGFETAGKQSCPSIKQCRLVLLNVPSGQRWRGGLFLRGCGIYWLCDNIHLVWWRITLFGLRRPWSTGAASGSGSRGQQRSGVTTLTYIPLHSCRGLRVK